MNYLLIKRTMKKINFILLIYLLFASFLTSCQSVKDGLTGKKSENSDEFLVQKKNPLVMPPDFEKLPQPEDKDAISESLQLEEETDIQKILKIDTDSQKISKDKFGSAEKFVLEKIK